MSTVKHYLKIKQGSMWVKRTKTKGELFYSVSIELTDGSIVSASLFPNRKGKESHPDFRTLPEKKDELFPQSPQTYAQPEYDNSPPPRFNDDDEIPF
jgi:hypothetical protein